VYVCMYVFYFFAVYLTALPVAHIAQRRMIGLSLNNEMERM
jgi:hypothetical protein